MQPNTCSMLQGCGIKSNCDQFFLIFNFGIANDAKVGLQLGLTFFNQTISVFSPRMCMQFYIISYMHTFLWSNLHRRLMNVIEHNNLIMYHVFAAAIGKY